MGRYGRCVRETRGVMGEESAQGTVEYALTVFAFLAMAVAFAAVWRTVGDGVFARLAEEAASHALDAAGAIDISLF